MKPTLSVILTALIAVAIGYGLGSFKEKEKIEVLGIWSSIESARSHLLNLHLLSEEEKEKLISINEAVYIASLTNLELATRPKPEIEINWKELKSMKDDWGIPDLLRHSRERIETIEFTTPERRSQAIELLNKIVSNQSIEGQPIQPPRD